EEIIEKICDKMKEEEQHIILLLYGVDSQKKFALDRILNDFWKPLTQKVKKSDIKYHLSMFWIDYKKKIDWRDIYIFPDKPQLAKEEMLFNLCVTSKFRKKDLDSWITGQEGQSILAKVDYDLVEKKQISQTSKTIWKESQNGKPELLLQVIYHLCKLTWEEYETRWQDL
ncbi:MAG: hypothetical protein SAK29_18100, partial [Scytonema sp. PMC 1069.18]|nr:hypothetical protein [Scytonema sp. PMC 1069.18]